jgi:hypothetical protein
MKKAAQPGVENTQHGFIFPLDISGQRFKVDPAFRSKWVEIL